MDMDFAQARRKMVDCQIMPVDVTKLSVLAAFRHIKRELFVPAGQRGAAYADGRIMLAPAKPGCPARYMMPPAALAKLAQLANIGSEDFILDVGAMTGYGAAVMAQLGSAVVALECDAALAAEAERLFTEYHCENISPVGGDLTQGCAAQAPFDVIMLEGAVDFVPKALFAQLREGGRLVAAEGRGNAAAVYLYERQDGAVSRRRAFNLALDILPGFERKEAFTF